jgi:hypothetical protein
MANDSTYGIVYHQKKKIYSTYMVFVTHELGEIIPLKNFEAMFQNKMCP